MKRTKFLTDVVRLVWLSAAVLWVPNLLGVPRLSLGTVRGFPGNTVEVPLSLSFGTNDPRNVVALQADVLFEQGVLTSGTPNGGTALAGHAVRTSFPSQGVRRVLVYSPNNALLSNGVVAQLPFTVPAGQFRNFTLMLANVILATASATSVSVATGNGGVAVSQVFVRSDGNADFFLPVLPEKPYVVQATTNFIEWVDLNTVTSSDPLLVQIDTDAHLYPYRFYRAVPLGGGLNEFRTDSDGSISFHLSGVRGRSFVLQASVDLEHWTDLSTNTASGGTIRLQNVITPAFPARFFRLKSE